MTKIAKGELLEKAVCMQTWEHLEYKSEKIEKIYDEARTSSSFHNSTDFGLGEYLC